MMPIGANWKEIWAAVWKSVWTTVPPAPPAFDQASWVFVVPPQQQLVVGADDRLMYVGQAENAMRVPPEPDPYVVQH